MIFLDKITVDRPFALTYLLVVPTTVDVEHALTYEAVYIN